MKLIDLKCPNCSANVKVNEDLENAVCNYCGTSFKVYDENETEEERAIKTRARMDEKAKASERKYYASDDYAKRLDIEADANDKSIVSSIGRQIKKSRDYYSSEEYKKRLEIQNEQSKKQLKQLIPIIVVGLLFLLAIPIIFSSLDLSSKEDDMTCTLNNKEYVIVMKKGETVSCATCDEELLNEFNNKYLDKDSVSVTKKNIRSYFTNNNGSCKG